MDKVITVVIPTYNRKRLTDRAVDSVKTSRPDLVEIIVVDDCGADPYSYAAQANPHGILVHVIRRDNNGGAGLARMTGVNAASGELIAFLDSDDEYCSAWIDALISEHISQDGSVRQAAIYAGRVSGGKISHSVVWHYVKTMPNGLRLLTGRVIAVLFNPFYTPSIAISKPICQFSDRLRFCEDYYTMVEAIFKAKRLVMIDEVACALGRKPNSPGGASGIRMKMFNGELSVRITMIKANYIPFLFKIIVPVGMVHQLLRSLLKLVLVRQNY